jgi:hypothetical protein
MVPAMTVICAQRLTNVRPENVSVHRRLFVMIMTNVTGPAAAIRGQDSVHTRHWRITPHVMPIATGVHLATNAWPVFAKMEEQLIVLLKMIHAIPELVSPTVLQNILVLRFQNQTTQNV